MHPFTKNDVKKRLLNNVRIFISISIVLSIFNPVFIASAASGATASVDDLTLDVGETSDISISIGNCSNVTALNVTLSFDNTIVEFVEASVHNDGFGSLSSTNSSGTVDIEVTGIDRFNATLTEQPVIDVLFKALESGSTVVSLDSVELTTDLGTYAASELNGGSISIVDVDQAPVLSPIGDRTATENQSLNFTISAVDPDGTAVTYSAENLPVGATLDSTSGYFEWTPGYDSGTSYNVNFIATSDGLDANETITISIVDVDQAPVLSPIGDRTATENQSLNFTISAVDPDGTAVTYSAENLPVGATLDSTSGYFEWTPGYDSGTSYNVNFIATSNGLDANETITITVTNVNAPPEFESISSKTVKVGKNLDFTISATDVDDGAILTYSNVSILPENATFDASTQEFDWTPSEDQEGTHSVEFNVTDEWGANDSMTVTITVTDSSTDSSSSSSSSGGGGGGGGATGEAYENIDFKDYVIKSVVKDIETVFSFSKEGNNIISVSFTTGLNGGQTKAVVEMLKGTSTLVSKAPSGTVYKNMNIWVGDGKFLPEMISDATVVFKVEKSWIESKDVDPDSIKLFRYSGAAWKQLTTSRTGESDAYFYYVAETPGFSPFAISSLKEEVAAAEASGEKTESASNDKDVKKSVNDKATPESSAATQEERSTGTAVMILILLGVVFIGLFGYNNREYCEECYEKARLRFGNPDGKRYRRIKK